MIPTLVFSYKVIVLMYGHTYIYIRMCGVCICIYIYKYIYLHVYKYTTTVVTFDGLFRIRLHCLTTTVQNAEQ